MKFGIFYELQLPRPWEEGDELRLYQNALTQLETADRLAPLQIKERNHVIRKGFNDDVPRIRSKLHVARDQRKLRESLTLRKREHSGIFPAPRRSSENLVRADENE